MRTRDHVTVGVVWLALCGAGFVVLFGYASTDDYAGWLIALGLAQVGPYVALATAAHGEPLGVGRRMALVLPTALWIGMCSLLAAGTLASHVWHGDALDLRPFYASLIAGLAAAIAFAIWFGRDRRPFPQLARRVLGVHLATALVLGAVAAIALRREEPGMWIVFAVPVAWPLPLLVACLPRRSEPLPPARIVE